MRVHWISQCGIAAWQLGNFSFRSGTICALSGKLSSGAAPLPPAKAQRSGLKKLPGCKLHLRGGNLVANLFRATVKMASVAAQSGTVIGMSINQSSALLLLLCLLLWRSWRNAASGSGWRGIHQRELIRAEQMKRQPKNNDAASLKGSSARGIGVIALIDISRPALDFSFKCVTMASTRFQIPIPNSRFPVHSSRRER